MRKKGLLVVIALLAMASLMAAMAFTRAQVNNSMTFSVVSTDEAKLALIANPDHAGVAKIVDNKLVLNFGPGMQPGSIYSYDNLFYIQNNTDKTIYVGLRFDSCYANKDSATNNFPTGLHTIVPSKDLATYTDGIGYPNALLLGGPSFRAGAYEGRTVALAPGEKIGLNFNFNINAAQNLMNKKFVLQVHAKDTIDGKFN